MATTLEDNSGNNAHASDRSNRNDRDERDATELEEIHIPDDNQSSSSDSVSSNEYRITPRRTHSRSSRQSSLRQDNGRFRAIRKFWMRHVVLTVPQKSGRDHLALERTFLAYIRTSVATSIIGVLIAQLFRLQGQTSHPPPRRFGFFTVGIPLSITCHCVAILIAGMGAHRFWRQQHAMALGKVYVGGWELNCIAALISAVVITIFVLAIAISVEIGER